MSYIKLFIEREKNIGQSALECPFKTLLLVKTLVLDFGLRLKNFDYHISEQNVAYFDIIFDRLSMTIDIRTKQRFHI